jgi:hypothetical protein
MKHIVRQVDEQYFFDIELPPNLCRLKQKTNSSHFASIVQLFLRKKRSMEAERRMILKAKQHQGGTQ